MYCSKRRIATCLIIFIIITFNSSLAMGQQRFINPTEGTVTHEKHGPNTNCKTHGNDAHTGMDIANSAGTPIVAPADGKVVDAGTSIEGGIWLTLQHPDGVRTAYQHLQEINKSLFNEKKVIDIGREVKQGQEIAKTGNTGVGRDGKPYGPHLHYSVLRNGVYQNPRDYTTYPAGTTPGAGGGVDLSSPGGDHPDETFSVNGMIFPIIDTTNKSYMTKDYVGILYNGYPIATSLLAVNYQAIAPREPDKLNLEEIKKFLAFIIPTGGFYGLENSEFLRTTLDEYVKQGGVLIVFAQQHGYEFSILPVPEEADGSFKKVAGYGWTEDQSCFADSVYIDSYHQILSGQNRSTPSLNVDGYFTNYPSNSTTLLRRTSNGQPAMIMYDYGLGKVIAITMYTDWAYGHSQASIDEKALVRDIISWAKKPAQFPEIKPGETVLYSIAVTNKTSSDAASIKLTLIDPNRNIMSEQIVTTFVPGGQNVSIPFSYTTNSISPLGIWWVDYTLLDAQGNILQPQTETDSGRFVVSNPPRTGYKGSGITFSIQSDSETFILNPA